MNGIVVNGQSPSNNDSPFINGQSPATDRQPFGKSYFVMFYFVKSSFQLNNFFAFTL